jgi:hypothetical protein
MMNRRRIVPAAVCFCGLSANHTSSENTETKAEKR